MKPFCNCIACKARLVRTFHATTDQRDQRNLFLFHSQWSKKGSSDPKKVSRLAVVTEQQLNYINGSRSARVLRYWVYCADVKLHRLCLKGPSTKWQRDEYSIVYSMNINSFVLKADLKWLNVIFNITIGFHRVLRTYNLQPLKSLLLGAWKNKSAIN